MATNDPSTKRPKFTLNESKPRQVVQPWRPTSRSGFERRPEHNYSKPRTTNTGKDSTADLMASLINQQTIKHSNQPEKPAGS